MQAVFCHGLESGPVGRKSLALREAGIAVDAPDFRGQNLAERMITFSEYLAAKAALPVVIGSSYGGLLALCTAAQLHQSGRRFPGMLLCAPALHRSEPPADSLDLAPHCRTIVVHGTADAVVPFEGSQRLADSHPELVELIAVADNHSLAASTSIIVDAARRLLGTGPAASGAPE